MHRILVFDDDLHTRLAISAWLKRCGFRVAIADGGPTGLAALEDAALGVGATRCLRKPFRPATLLSVIDECQSEVEPHRRHAAILAGRDRAVGTKGRSGAAGFFETEDCCGLSVSTM